MRGKTVIRCVALDGRLTITLVGAQPDSVLGNETHEKRVKKWSVIAKPRLSLIMAVMHMKERTVPWTSVCVRVCVKLAGAMQSIFQTMLIQIRERGGLAEYSAASHKPLSFNLLRSSTTPPTPSRLWRTGEELGHVSGSCVQKLNSARSSTP